MQDNLLIAIAIAIAENDDEREPFAKYTLEEEFERYGINSEIEIEIDSLHGWCPSNSAVYNEARAEKAWSRLLELFEKSLV